MKSHVLTWVVFVTYKIVGNGKSISFGLISKIFENLVYMKVLLICYWPHIKHTF